MNESMAAAEGNSTDLTEQTTPAIHHEVKNGQNISETMLSVLSTLQESMTLNLLLRELGQQKRN